MSKRKISTVLFDLDGTLRDSRQAIHPAIDKALAEHGYEVKEQGSIASHVHSLRATHAAFVPDASYESFRAAYDANLKELLHTIVLYEHAEAVLKELKAQGFKLALVSSSRFAREALEQEGLTDYFDAIIGGLDTDNHKPHPEPIEMALAAIKASAAEAVMVGDLSADILSGQAAGVASTIGVTHGFGSCEMLVESGADHIIDSLEELPKILKNIG